LKRDLFGFEEEEFLEEVNILKMNFTVRESYRHKRKRKRRRKRISLELRQRQRKVIVCE
jgi:hypothetical protein